MISPARRLTSARDPIDRCRPHLVPALVVLGAVLLANLPALLHLVTTNPLAINAQLSPGQSGVLPGFPYIDPNAGFTTQALGHLAALDWLHGHVPWWNPLEGVGSPLAGEMQSGAFFPPTLLLAFQHGLLFLQLTLELVTGWSTYLLIRRLGVGRTFSTTAGVAFGLCGTYAWLAHAPIRPVALLPLSLLGVERALSAAVERRTGGWRLLAVAIGLSVLAGFPETTLIDGALVALWAALRLAGPGRSSWRPFLRKVVGGAVAGVALSAPLLVAFVTYLPFADLGGHGGSGFAYASLPTKGLSQVILPYSLGPIFGLHSTGPADVISDIWANVGGFLSATLIAAGLVGLVGRRHRMLRLGLGVWVAVCLLRTYGFPPVVHLMALVPGMPSIAFFRYADPSWELAVTVLAALGMDDLARHLTRRRVLAFCIGVTAAVAVWAAVTAWPVLTTSTAVAPSRGAHRHIYAIGNLAAALILLLALLVGGAWAGRRPGRPRTDRIRHRGRLLMAGAVSIEAIVLLGFTYLSAPPPTTLEIGSVTWLQANLGAYRFYTLGPIQPNYGSYFGIAQINLNDLPRPKAISAYVLGHLDPNSPSGGFTGGARTNPSGPTPAQELTKYLANYKAVGVRYVVEPAAGTDVMGKPFPAAGSPSWPAGPRLVYRDTFAEIWELPGAAPAFSVSALTTKGSGGSAGPCTVTSDGWDRATVICPHPSVLTRRVQYVAGWSATADGRAVVVRQAADGPSGLFQQVDLPAGTSTVRFTFLPPHEVPATVAAAVALAAILGSWLVGRRRRAPTAG